MKYDKARTRLETLRGKIASIRTEMRATQVAIEPQRVDDHAFATLDGAVKLSTLFGRKKDLFVIHNMGTTCPYCTMWADGFNGLHDHLASRAAFVVVSPDPPAIQRDFAAARGWRFRMLSDTGGAFARAMGYATGDGRPLPGVSVFARNGKAITRVSDAALHPLDDFCATWHLLDLLPAGADGWQPRLAYAKKQGKAA